MDVRIGDLIPGIDLSYTITEVLGGGAFGLVYKGTASTGELAAIKTIRTALLDDTGLHALVNEGRNLSRVRHPNVISVLYFHDGQTHPNLPPYIIMDYADGGTLAEVIAARSQSGQFPGDAELRSAYRELSEGMRAINSVLVHRDIKPDNILISGGALRISDFGLSKLAAAATRSSTFKGINHVKYCAPEAWRLETNTIAMDMYSMGVVFYELACFRNPLEREKQIDVIEGWRQAHLSMIPDDPRNQNPAISLRLSQIILKLIAKRPQDRYTTWDEVLDALGKEDGGKISLPNVNQLVEKAVKYQQVVKQAQLAAESKRQKRTENESLVAYSFNSLIVAVAQATVDAFNTSSESVKLHFKARSTLSFAIVAEGISSREILGEVRIVNGEHRVSGKKVKAWGFVKSSSGRGFNLVLIEDSPDDFYGSWTTLHVTHSLIARRRDSRPDPFFFSYQELPREIQVLAAMHIYRTKIEPFSRDHLDPLIGELFEV